ncbi:MAG: ABC transporter substrate-binding protein [Caldilineaceae bacterium]
MPDQTPQIVTREIPVTVEVTREVPVTPAPATRCAPENIVDAEEIRIGILIPLSSPGAAQAGNAMQAAFNIAAEHVNSNGGIHGKNIRLVVEDTQGNPDWGAAKAKSLITQDCVVALAGVYHSRVAMSVKDVAHNYKTPIVFAEPYMDEVTADLYPEVFRIAPTFSMLNETDMGWLKAVGDYNGDGQQTIVLITENNEYGLNRAKMVTDLYTEQGILVESVPVDLPTDNFSSAIARIVALTHKPDVMYIWFSDEAGFTFQQQLGQAGIGPSKGTVLVARQSALDAEAFWTHLPDGTYTVVQKIGPWYSTVTEVGDQFATDYRTYFDRWPESYAFEAYDSLRLLAHAIENAQSLAPDLIIESLESIDIELASGRYYFPYGAQNRPAATDTPAYMWHQWPNVPLLYLQYTEPNQLSSDMSVLWPEVYRTADTPIFRPLP